MNFRKGLEDEAVRQGSRRSENAVHTEESEDGNSSESQKWQETEHELLGTALGDEVEIDASNGTSAIWDRLVRLVHTDLLKVLFSTAPLRQRLSVFQISDNATNIAYSYQEVKPNRETVEILH